MTSLNNFVIGNWKSNGDREKAFLYVSAWNSFELLAKPNVVICPPFNLLETVKELNNVSLGVQNISPFALGSFTGEVCAENIAGFVSFAIVGHSERRKFFGETMEIINKKIERLLKNEITPIFCFEDLADLEKLKSGFRNTILVYEPSENISSGGNYKSLDFPKLSTKIIEIRQIVGDTCSVLYGGSVNAKNNQEVEIIGGFNGVLVGKASLDPLEFYTISKSWLQ